MELTARLPNHAEATNPTINKARGKLDNWQSGKQSSK